MTPAAALLLVVVLAGATLGEGGARPFHLLLIHGTVVAVLLVDLTVSGESRRVPHPRPLGAFVVFLFLVLCGAVVAPCGYDAFLVLLELGIFLAVVVLAARWGTMIPAFAGPVLLAGAGAQGALALWQRLVLGELRPAGTFLNPNHLGAWLVACLLLGLAGAGGAGWRRPASLLRAAAAVPALAGLAASGSRGALLGLVAGLVYLVPSYWTRMGRRARGALIAGAAAVLAVAGAGVAARLQVSDPFLYHRLAIWEASLGAVVDAPWTGTGPGQFAAASANLNFPVEDKGPLRYERFFSSPHSDLLRLPCELGWPAALAMAFSIALAAREIRRRRRGELAGAGQAAVAALLALGAQAVVDDLTDRPALYLLAGALLGSLLSTPAGATARRPSALRVGGAVILVLSFITGDVATYLAWSRTKDLPHGRLGREERTRLDGALEANPLDPELWLRHAEDLGGEGALRGAGAYAIAREAAERSVRLHRARARYALGLARIEARACKLLFRDEATRARAARQYGIAAGLERHNPFIPIEQGRFLLETGDAAGARRAAEHALAIEPRAIPPRLLLAASLLSVGGAREALRAQEILREARQAAVMWKDWPRATPYARNLLTLDSEWALALERRIAELLAASPVDPGPDSP